MGRTKVRPELRRRVVRACEACKTSKRRCDGQHPCSRCCRQNCAAMCVYPDDQARPHTPTLRRPSRLSSAGEDQDNIQYPSTLSPAPSHLTQESPPISSSANEETFFVGPSAALSFVYLLRKILRRRAVRSNLDISARTDATAQPENQGQPGDDITVLRDGQLLDTYIDNFLSITSGILYVLSKDEIRKGLDADAPRSRQTIVSIAVAIGSRANMSNDTDKTYSDAYSRVARHHLAQDYLLDPTLDHAIASLLMAFYTLLCHQRNPTYMHLGHAVRCAHALGLHQLVTTSNPNEERAKVWMSICVMDVAVCSILGRPSGVALTLPKSQAASPGSISGCHRGVLILWKAFEATKIVEEALRTMHVVDSKQPRDTEDFLRRLTAWRESILQGFGGDNEEGLEADWLSIAKMNLSCLYYHGVLLITRPYLIAFFEDKSQYAHESATQHGKNSPAPDATPAADLNHRLAEVCTDAAIYMIDAVHDTWKTNILLSNMCFTKAWAFSAGLILGFSMLIQPVAGPAVKRSMNQAIDYLHAQSDTSPYARQYHNILVDVLKSIDNYHERQLEQRRLANSSLLGRAMQSEVKQTNTYDCADSDATHPQSLDAHIEWNLNTLDIIWDESLTAWDTLLSGCTTDGEFSETMWPSSLSDNFRF